MRRKEMLVDLTPLLDVILILLFLVLAANHSRWSEQKAALEQQISTLEKTQIPTNDSQRAWLSAFEDSVAKVHLIYPTDLTKDSVRMVTGNGEVFNKPATEDFNQWLQKKVEALPGKVVIVVFTYANDAIYYRDYLNTRRWIQQLEDTTGKTVIYREEQENMGDHHDIKKSR